VTQVWIVKIFCDKFSALPLRSLRLCGNGSGVRILQPQRRRERRGRAEKIVLGD